MKQLTLIKVAGVVMSLAAFGGGMAHADAETATVESNAESISALSDTVMALPDVVAHWAVTIEVAGELVEDYQNGGTTFYFDTKAEAEEYVATFVGATATYTKSVTLNDIEVLTEADISALEATVADLETKLFLTNGEIETLASTVAKISTIQAALANLEVTQSTSIDSDGVATTWADAASPTHLLDGVEQLLTESIVTDSYEGYTAAEIAQEYEHVSVEDAQLALDILAGNAPQVKSTVDLVTEGELTTATAGIKTDIASNDIDISLNSTAIFNINQDISDLDDGLYDLGNKVGSITYDGSETTTITTDAGSGHPVEVVINTSGITVEGPGSIYIGDAQVATEDWVNNKDYATTTYVDGKIADIDTTVIVTGDSALNIDTAGIVTKGMTPTVLSGSWAAEIKVVYNEGEDRWDVVGYNTAGEITGANGNADTEAGAYAIIAEMYATGEFTIVESVPTTEITDLVTEGELAAGIATESAYVSTSSGTYVDIDEDSVYVYTETSETLVDNYGVTVYQYEGEGDVTVSVNNGGSETLLNNAADIDALESSSVSIGADGQVSTGGHVAVYTLGDVTYTENSQGGYDVTGGTGTTTNTLPEGAVLTNPEVNLVTESELATAIDGIEVNVEGGDDGLSAYDIAVSHGFTGSAAEWLDSLKGDKGDPGTGSTTTETSNQADVDQNEADSDSADKAIQDDVDQNELDSDAADKAIQDDVDQNEADSDAADAALSDRIDDNANAIASNDLDIADIQAVNDQQWDAIGANTAKNVEQDGRLDAVEAKNVEQDKILADHEVRITQNTADIAENREDIGENRELITISAADLTALIAKATADIADEITHDFEAKIERIEAEAEARIDTYAERLEGKIAASNLSVANTVAIVTLEDQWNTDPVLGNFDISKVTGQRVRIEVANGVFEDRVARVEDIQTIADRVADNTSRIQRLENAVFVDDKDSALDRLQSDLWSRAKLARKNNVADYVMTAAGLVDLRGHTGGFTSHSGGIMISLSDTMAYNVLGLGSTWVALK